MNLRVITTAGSTGPDGNLPHQWVPPVPLAIRQAQAVGSGGRYNFLEGRAVPYDTDADIGWFVESHRDGSFKGSTKAGSGKNAPLLLFHDNRSFPIGHGESWRHDGGGLDGVWRLNDRPEAQEAARMAEAGDLVGMSIGFQPIRSEWEFLGDDAWNPDLGPDHKDRVTRLESRLLEVSLTPTPAFADAQVAAVRAAPVYTRAARSHFLPERDVDRWRREIDRLKSAAR